MRLSNKTMFFICEYRIKRLSTSHLLGSKIHSKNHCQSPVAFALKIRRRIRVDSTRAFKVKLLQGRCFPLEIPRLQLLPVRRLSRRKTSERVDSGAHTLFSWPPGRFWALAQPVTPVTLTTAASATSGGRSNYSGSGGRLEVGVRHATNSHKRPS